MPKAFMMSTKKRRSLRAEEQRKILAEAKKIAKLKAIKVSGRKSHEVANVKISNMPPPVIPVVHEMFISEGKNSTPKKEENVYTGSNLLGVTAMHKSSYVPVFSKETATEIAKMRRG